MLMADGRWSFFGLSGFVIPDLDWARCTVHRNSVHAPSFILYCFFVLTVR